MLMLAGYPPMGVTTVDALAELVPLYAVTVKRHSAPRLVRRVGSTTHWAPDWPLTSAWGKAEAVAAAG